MQRHLLAGIRRNAIRKVSPLSQGRTLHLSPPRRESKPPSGPPRSPFQVFVQVFREELDASRQMQDDLKQLQGAGETVKDLEAIRKARAVYEKARITKILQDNPKLRAAADNLRASGGQLTEAVSEAMKGMEDSAFFRSLARTSEALKSATAPVRETETYKFVAETVMDALDDTSFGGYEDRDARRLRRQRRLMKAGRSAGLARTKANPEAGEAMVLSESAAKASASNEAWENAKISNPVLKKFGEIKTSLSESDNAAVLLARHVGGKVRSWFDETEMAQVTKRMKQLDPAFRMDTFEADLREYIVPEVIDALLSRDQESLQFWCGEAAYSSMWANLWSTMPKEIVSEYTVHDIHSVTLDSGRMLDSVPVFVVRFQTFETSMHRHKQTGEILAGGPDKLDKVFYSIAVMRSEDELDNELTGGWKMARRVIG